MKKAIFSFVLAITFFFPVSPLSAQFTDNFNDGDFTNNPPWIGNTADFIVNPAFQLQSNNLVANSTFYLSTANSLATMAQWEFYVNITFNPSSANLIDVFLTSSSSDLTNVNATGYFVRIGNTDDEISLYRKDAGGGTVKIIDGLNGILNVSSSVMKIKVIRAAGNQWTLFRDLTGTGNNYVSEGVITDGNYTTSSFFGVLVRQSTASFFQRHFFDDIEVKPFVPDVTPPAIQTLTAQSPATLDVLFNEPVDLTTAQTLANYSVSGGIGLPATAVRNGANPALVNLTFTNPFPNGANLTLTVNGVKDLAGNTLVNGTGIFSFYIPQRYDVVIDEILADPTPVVALPNAEFIEIKNVSGRPLNLQGWKISSLTSTSAAFPSYVLPADSFLVITGTSSVSLFTQYGRVIGITSFPSLDNTTTTLTLTSKEGIAIHAVTYNVSWYNNVLKADGGWTLEMVDTKNPCNGLFNWRASVDPRGGTPAAKNSVDGNNPDIIPPTLVRAAAIDSVTVLVTFSERMDSLKAATTSRYSISDGIGVPVSASATSPTFRSVRLTLSTPLIKNKVYQLTVNNTLTDCSGNAITGNLTTRLGLASTLDSFDVVINELLFDPKSGFIDFLEIYNRSAKIINLKDLSIANRSSTTDLITNIKLVSTDNAPLFPGDYMVISENQGIVKQNFNALNPNNFIDLTSMPSYPDDKGVAVLLDQQGRIVDQLRYDRKWHFGLLDNKEGISLERIDFNKPTQNQLNWHSAASTVGFATPSYQNSQYRMDNIPQGEFTVTPKTISPDNDGFDDFATINFQLAENGFVANITIFDAAGHPVRALVKNATLAQKGSYRWDGLDDKSRKVPVGVYVFYTEIFNLAGQKRSFKNTVIVAARF